MTTGKGVLHMLSVIEVKCPHCGALGQVMLPPMGSIIVGPCPRCEELVVLFEGRIFPLDKNIMLYGTPEKKREHLLDALMRFLKERVDDLITESVTQSKRSKTQHSIIGTPALHREKQDPAAPSVRSEESGPITRGEVKDFVSIDLNLVGKKEYFERVFGTVPEEDEEQE